MEDTVAIGHMTRVAVDRSGSAAGLQGRWSRARREHVWIHPEDGVQRHAPELLPQRGDVGAEFLQRSIHHRPPGPHLLQDDLGLVDGGLDGVHGCRHLLHRRR